MITGGAGGIARTIIARLISAGWDVAVGDVDQTRLDETRLLRSAFTDPRISTHRLDVTDDRSCAAVVEQVLDTFGRLDALVNNAGIMVRRSALDTSIDEWQRVLDVNLTGAFRMARACYAPLTASPNPAIVSVSSSHAVMAAKGSVAYSTSKAALTHLTRLLALEWAEWGIRVNAVGPTVVPSPMTQDVLSDPSYVARKLTAIPLGAPVQAEHVAAAVEYLLSPDSGSTTGQTLLLDGGESLP